MVLFITSGLVGPVVIICMLMSILYNVSVHFNTFWTVLLFAGNFFISFIQLLSLFFRIAHGTGKPADKYMTQPS